MQIGKVIGYATSTVKHPSFRGSKLLLVQLFGVGGALDGDPILAIDELGAGAGCVVILTNDGLSAREAVRDKTSPVRWMVLGVCG